MTRSARWADCPILPALRRDQTPVKTPPADFIRANTAIAAPVHLPEIRLHLADEALSLWHKTENELGLLGLPPPFWAFAWAGGQGLARHILDFPELVKGRSVLDFGTGSGVVAIAAALAGARQPVGAIDVDPWSVVAAGLNARLNGVDIDVCARDIIGHDEGWDVVLAGDVFYDKAMTDRVLPWLEALAGRGAQVIVGDPGRSYCPRDRLRLEATYCVPVTRALEDADVKTTSVWRVIAPEQLCRGV